MGASSSTTRTRMSAEPTVPGSRNLRGHPYTGLTAEIGAPMPVTRMNHAVLYVRDIERTVTFYRDVLDFRTKVEIPGRAAFLQAPASQNDHDLGLFQVGQAAADSPAGRGAVGLYHLAWEVDTLDELDRLAGRLRDAGALVGASDHGATKALYAHDPDGIEFEVCWLVPADELSEDMEMVTRPLDLDAEKRRYGASTRGGVGVSFPALV